MESDRSRNDTYQSGANVGSSGPFIAKVITNNDPMRQGALEVELLSPIGNQPSASQQLFTVRYLSPFYGVTDVDLNGSDPEEFNHTQKSYGFWFVPPDTGTLVMVMFVNGEPGQGYWFGCVQNVYMNYMIPGIAGSKSLAGKTRESDETKWDGKTSDTKTTYNTDFIPVGEVNRGSIKTGNSTINPKIDEMKKPVHPLADALMRQGLLTDTVRGPTTSSARRDTPSNVFGISTPGPLDKRTNAQKGSVGRSDSKVNKFISRLGGHQFIMDDGNDRMLRKYKPDEGPSEYVNLEDGGSDGLVDYPQDESFRIRTRTGHQILLHNSEDLIYITNAQGSAWIEMTSNGKIDIYAADSVSIRTEEDFNFVAERDINLHAQRAINLFSGSRTSIESGDNLNLKAGSGLNFSSTTDLSLNSGKDVSLNAGKGLNIKAQDTKITGAIVDILASGALHMTSSADLNIKGNRTMISSNRNTEILSGSSTLLTSANLEVGASGGIILKGATIKINDPGASPISASQAVEAVPAVISGSPASSLVLYPLPGVGPVLVKRAPTAEPWAHHENTNPPGFTADLTDRESPQMPYALNAERLTIRSTADAEKVPAELGGNAGYEGGPSSGAGGGSVGKRFKNSKGSSPTDIDAANSDPNSAVKTDYNDGSLGRMPGEWLKDQEFIAKSAKLASKYGQKVEELITLMRLESNCSPTVRNPWGYTGLIQFGPGALTMINKAYGTNWNTDNIRELSRAQQLDIVEQYFDYWKKALKIGDLSLGRMYILIFLPKYVNYPEDHVIATLPAAVVANNKTLADNGVLSVRSIMAKPNSMVDGTAQMLKRAGY